ncbi:isochorismate synthase [Amycolatopsis methanolica]|uniref:isochorismate synthase n=1 Tax=Amycolatopsis methanolica 239 TaxID=1068978 RepID=A0A076MYM0_AMYME|nr:isochorismate synthase [Amycolatopsis methanolica]AIJ26289.1 isochorismate synthase [Amycolatopsis methanolica 239]
MDARETLEEYTPGDFYFATSRHTIFGSGSRLTFTGTDVPALGDAVPAALAGTPGSLAVGVLPFDTTATPGHLVVPEAVQVAAPAHPAAADLPRMTVDGPDVVRAVPEPVDHAEAVARAVRALSDRGMRKVVLARALDLEFSGEVPVKAVLHNLVKDNPHGYTFAAALPGGRSLIGATPELLVSRSGRRVVSHPHAGSAPRSADPVTDRENAERLAASRKDHVEHAVLTEAIVETLRPFCRDLHVPRTPSLVSTPTMWHLSTMVTGELTDPDVTALHLAGALHPTPAICGSPTEDARQLVGELEPFDRGYYAGTVGWMDANGDGEWAVSIRCAEVSASRLRLYAGGGIVPASDPKAELDETSAKFQTLLRAMGLEL